MFRKQNGGLSSARNIGLNYAQGRYISFVEGDDYIHPKMIEWLYQALTETEADISGCNALYIDEEVFGSFTYQY